MFDALFIPAARPKSHWKVSTTSRLIFEWLGARGTKVTFFGFFKSAWIFACACQLISKTFPSRAEMLCSVLLHSLCMLRYFVFVFLRNKVQTSQKKYRGMFYYLIEKHMQKFRHFWRNKKFTWKSHLCPSCTNPFNCKFTK